LFADDLRLISEFSRRESLEKTVTALELEDTKKARKKKILIPSSNHG
jgi:hypothetical protein